MTLGRYRSLVSATGIALLWAMSAGSSSTAGAADPIRIVVKEFMFNPTSLKV